MELRSNNDLYQVGVAQLISIVPGTLVVEVVRRPRLLYLHVFDLPDDASIEAERTHALDPRATPGRGNRQRLEIEAVRR